MANVPGTQIDLTEDLRVDLDEETPSFDWRWVVTMGGDNGWSMGGDNACGTCTGLHLNVRCWGKKTLLVDLHVHNAALAFAATLLKSCLLLARSPNCPAVRAMAKKISQ